MQSTQNNSAANGAIHERFQRLQSMLRHDAGNVRLARECMDTALEAGAYDFVLEQSARALASSPTDPQALFDRASALIGMRQFREAIEVLSGLLAAQPHAAPVRMNLGLCHYCLGGFAEAREILQPVYDAGDRSAGLLRLLVSSLHHVGEIGEATKLCNENPEAAAADGALAGVYALVYLDADEAPAAARFAGRALVLNENNIDGLVVQATLRILKMEVARAKTQFDHVLELAPATGRAWIGLGTLALLENDLPLAQKQLKQGLEYMPGHVGSWHMLAWTYLMANDLDAAEAALLHALEMDRNFAETHGGLASVAALRGRREEAERLIEVALRLDDECLSAQFARSALMRMAGNPAGGSKLIRDTVARLGPMAGGLLGRVIDRVTRH